MVSPGLAVAEKHSCEDSLYYPVGEYQKGSISLLSEPGELRPANFLN